VESNTSDVHALPTDDDGCAAASDRSTTIDRLSPALEAGQKAVDLLSTVSGHGANKLLIAARRLVEQSLDPCHAIAAWYLEYNCNNSRKNKKGRRPGTIPVAGNSVSRRPNKKALKSACYRRNVTEWRKNASSVAERVLTGVDQGALMPPASEMTKYWVPIIKGNCESRPQTPAVSFDTHGSPQNVTIFDAMSPQEVSECLPSKTTAPGPDGFPARLWRRLPCNLIADLFNLFIAYGSLPPILVKSRTVFVAKKGDPQCPGNY